MGQKVNPYGLRIKINKDWKSKWYFDKKSYATALHEDFLIRREIMNFLKDSKYDISSIEIIRSHLQKITVVILTPRPGVIIGLKGANLEKLGIILAKKINIKINLKVKEIKKPEFDAKIVANSIAKQIENRASYRKVLKSTLANSMNKGAQGIKIKIGGRLGGADIARDFEVKEGRVPLHTLRANIDYGFSEAKTTFGIIGIKVWIFKGEILGKSNRHDAGALIKKPNTSVLKKKSDENLDDSKRNDEKSKSLS